MIRRRGRGEPEVAESTESPVNAPAFVGKSFAADRTLVSCWCAIVLKVGIKPAPRPPGRGTETSKKILRLMGPLPRGRGDNRRSTKNTMPVRTLQTITLLVITAVVAVAFYCGTSGIRSLDDFRNYRAMRSVSDPIVIALADGILPADATTQDMLAIASPQWSENYGRCVIYGFTSERSYDQHTIVTIDGRLASAHVGSCTWQWSFYNNIPDDVAEAVARVRDLRATMERVPEYAQYMQPLLDEQLDLLDVQVNSADKEAEPSGVTHLGERGVRNGRSIGCTR